MSMFPIYGSNEPERGAVGNESLFILHKTIASAVIVVYNSAFLMGGKGGLMFDSSNR